MLIYSPPSIVPEGGLRAGVALLQSGLDTTARQHCDDAIDALLIELNDVPPKLDELLG